jgi:hypothetical protein
MGCNSQRCCADDDIGRRKHARASFSWAEFNSATYLHHSKHVVSRYRVRCVLDSSKNAEIFIVFHIEIYKIGNPLHITACSIQWISSSC